MLKKLMVAAFIAVILMSTNAKAAETTNNYIVNEYKNWTIHFNREVAFDDLSKQGIIVTDSKGNKVNAQLELGKDNKSIIVEYPTLGYLLGERYQLTVNNKVHDKNNKGIKQIACINFNIEPTNKDAVIFKDKVFQDAVKNYIKKPNEEVLNSDVQKLTSFSTLGFNVEDISGIDKFVNLENLNLSNTKVKDISSLSSLRSLKGLDLDVTQVSDITPLEGLDNLQEINLGGTKIKDINSLSSLTSLESLALNNTQISDITPLKKLYNLEVLDLSNTKVNDISALKELKNLEEIYLVNAPIKDLSVLKELDNLEALNLDNTQISDIDTLKGLKNLKELIVINLSDSEQEILQKALPNCKILGL